MLVISRKAGESFLIGDSIEVFILDAGNDKVKVGIEAPAEIKIIRKELKETENINRESMKLSDHVDVDVIKEVLINENNI